MTNGETPDGFKGWQLTEQEWTHIRKNEDVLLTASTRQELIDYVNKIELTEKRVILARYEDIHIAIKVPLGYGSVGYCEKIRRNSK